MKTVGGAWSPGVPGGTFQKLPDGVSGRHKAVTFSCGCLETGRRSVTQNFPNIDPERVAEKSLKITCRFLALKLPYSLHESHRRRAKIGINRFVTQQANHSTAGTHLVLQPLRSKSEGIWGCQTGALHPLSDTLILQLPAQSKTTA